MIDSQALEIFADIHDFLWRTNEDYAKGRYELSRTLENLLESNVEHCNLQKCPACGSYPTIGATICPYCNEDLDK